MDRYLHPGDYTIQIRSEIKTLLGGADEKKLAIAETAAANQMKSYLKKRYDISNIFFLFSKFDPALVYTQPAAVGELGKLVYFRLAASTADEDYAVYQCITTTTAGQSPESHPAKWQLFTSRNSFIMMMLADCTIYHLHSGHASRLIPEERKNRYQDVLDWLKLAGKGEIDADLPQLAIDDAEATSDIRYNSHELEDQRW
jgi:phage gp36-like protein